MFRYLLLICGGVFFCSKMWSANGELELAANLTIKDGLAHNGITSLLEDSKGYIVITSYSIHYTKLYDPLLKSYDLIS